MPRFMEAVGLTELQEDLYEILLDQPGLTAKECLPHLGPVAAADPAEVIDALNGLRALGLCALTGENGDRHTPAPPDLAVEALVLRRRAELERVRLHGVERARRFRHRVQAADVSEIVQVIHGREEIAQYWKQAQAGAQFEVMMTDCPPYSTGSQPALNQQEIDNLGRDVVYRCIYHQPWLTPERGLDEVEHYLAAGEDGRVLPHVPMKMAIIDHHTAVLPLILEAPSYTVALVVRGSLLVALEVAFESLWAKAVPLKAEDVGAGQKDSLTPRLISLLTSGMKDESIARGLGISQRTLGRHMERLMSDLGARTRFQAGLQVGRGALGAVSADLE
jgi:hypothetical protein